MSKRSLVSKYLLVRSRDATGICLWILLGARLPTMRRSMYFMSEFIVSTPAQFASSMQMPPVGVARVLPCFTFATESVLVLMLPLVALLTLPVLRGVHSLTGPLHGFQAGALALSYQVPIRYWSMRRQVVCESERLALGMWTVFPRLPRIQHSLAWCLVRLRVREVVFTGRWLLDFLVFCSLGPSVDTSSCVSAGGRSISENDVYFDDGKFHSPLYLTVTCLSLLT